MEKKNTEKTSFFNYIEKGVQNKIICFNQDQTQITYCIKQSYTTSFKNPEEKVRAAYFCELVLYYQYPVERILFEVPIKPDKDRIDLIVYKDAAFKEPYIVVECKKYGISDGEFQNAIEQAFRYANYIKAYYIVVMAGDSLARFNVKDFVSGERKENILGDIPIRYGNIPKYKYYKQEGKDLKIVSRGELIKAFKKCHDIVWQGGKLAPTTAFDEVAKLLFCKLRDEKSTIKQKSYQFQIGTYETPKDILARIETIYRNAKQQNEEVFKENIHLSPEVVFSCVKHLQDFAINNIDLDSKGIAFEKFMQDFFKGKMGQFFTPRNVVRFAVYMMCPCGNIRVLDPACGSGGFLLNAMDYVRNYAQINYIDELEIFRHWHDFAKDRLFGIEINDQIARVCKINMILHDDGHTNIIRTDSLKDIKNLQSLNKQFKKDSFDLILTNPPFGATVKVSEKAYLKKYVLGQNKKNQKTEILFIERCIEFLKPETGKMAIVLPDGILTNRSLQYVRDYILETCQLLAVVSLPQITFKHYGAGVKSSLLFVRKKGNNEHISNYPIFMAIAEFIGYDATGRETPDKNDLPEILEEYRKFEQMRGVAVSSDRQNKIFLIKQNELKSRLDSAYYKPEFLKNCNKVRSISHKQLGELVSFSNEKWNQKDFFTNKFPYIQISNIDIKTGDINNILEMNISDAPSRAKMVVRENDILISTTAPNRGAIALIDKRLDGFIASTGFAIIRKINIEIRNIDLQTGDINNIFEIPISEAPSSAKMIVRENDIIISKTRPSRGAISLIDKRFDGFIASTGFAVVRNIKDEINRNYLFYVLRIDSTLKQFEQRSSGGIYPSITITELQKVWIPFPPQDTQIRIAALMGRAYARIKENDAEAARLLNSINNYVLTQLGIQFPEVKQEKVLIVNVEDIKGQRFDVEYNQFKSFENQLSIKNSIKIIEFIIDYKKGIEVGSNQYVNNGTIPFVRISDINENSLNLQQTKKKISDSLFKQLKQNFSPKKGEILYTKDGTIGLSYLVTTQKNYIVSSSFLRLICENIQLAKFLKIILSLKVYKEMANKKSSGTIIKHLNLKEFLNIPIPFPEKQKRDKIVNKVDEIKAKIKSLKKEAVQVIEKAKQEVEDILFKT